ncbi:hypothetical protein MRX96_017439 [Rhipicephalus microplus]
MGNLKQAKKQLLGPGRIKIATLAPEFFQREVLRVLKGIEGQASLQDDIIVFGPSREELAARLHKVLQYLQEAGITLNAEKCILHQQFLRPLGYIVSANGISADSENVNALCHLAEPTDVIERRRMVLGQAIARNFQRCQESIDNDSSAYSLRPL